MAVRLIDALELKRSIACSSILEDGKTLEQIIDEQPTIEPEQRWIPCSERLPEDDTKVLCQTMTKKGVPGFVIGYYAFDRWCCGMNSNVVAWMPLPAPYEEE